MAGPHTGDALELTPVSWEAWLDVPDSFEEGEERRLRALALMK
jgi:hypothetical protein